MNITIIQAYAATSDYDDEAVEDIYAEIQEVLDKTPKLERHCRGQDYWMEKMPTRTGKVFADSSAMQNPMREVYGS